jgi:hypothetical protein
LLLLEIGSTFQKFVSGIMNNHGLVEVKQHWLKNSILCSRFWVATHVKECRLGEIEWDMQLNAHRIWFMGLTLCERSITPDTVVMHPL